MTTSAGMELAKRLRERIDGYENDPGWRGLPPYAMPVPIAELHLLLQALEAAAFLSHPVDTGQGVGEEDIRELLRMIDHVQGRRSVESVYGIYNPQSPMGLLVEKIRAALTTARPPLASVEGVDEERYPHINGREIYECANQLQGYVGPSTPEHLAKFLLREADAACDLANEIMRLRALAQSGRSSAEPVAWQHIDKPHVVCTDWTFQNNPLLTKERYRPLFATPPVGRQEAVATEPVAWQTRMRPTGANVWGDWHFGKMTADNTDGWEWEERALYTIAPTGDSGALREALAAGCYMMSEPHLSGYRLIIGFDTLPAIQNAMQAVATALSKREPGK